MITKDCFDWTHPYEPGGRWDRDAWRLGTRKAGRTNGDIPLHVLSRCGADVRDPAEGRIVPVPSSIAPDAAIGAPLLAAMLGVWEDLRIELGDAAVIAGEGTLASFAAIAAVASGSVPVVRLGGEIGGPEAVPCTVLGSNEPESVLSRLKAISDGERGVGMLDLGGDSCVLDILLEAMPRYGRLMLAGWRSQPATLDYYNNLHRKGVLLLARELEPAALLDAPAGSREETYLCRSFTILEDPVIAGWCRQASAPAHVR